MFIIVFVCLLLFSSNNGDGSCNNLNEKWSEINCNKQLNIENKYSVLANNVLVITVATSKTDGYERYIRSAREYGIEPVTIGLGSEWLGGDVQRSTGGGFKVNKLREELEPYKTDADKIVLFTDGYDVIFLSNLQTIVKAFKETEAKVLFAAESSCWPDSSLADKYPLPTKGKRYLNSGAFIAYAPELYDILTYEELADDGDDQLYYTKIYLDENKREKLKFKLDYTSQIFQNLYGALDDVELQFDDKEAYLENVAYTTRPLILHGNGLSKVPFNALTNYLARAWTPELECVACRDNVIDLAKVTEEQSIPLVVMALFVEQATPFYEEHLEKIYDLMYPKSRIHLFIHNAIKYHAAHIKDFVSKYGSEYASVKQITPDDEINEWSARDLALDHCLKKNCDIYFNVDAVVHLDNSATLRLLIEQNRSVVAPMLIRPGKAWSNFWGALTTDGFYARSTDYMDIVHNERRGLWNVPFISNCYVINATILRQYDRKKLGHVFNNFDADMSLCTNIRNLGVFMYVSNRVDFGHLINPETYDISMAAPDMYQIFENALDWERRYIHPDYPDNLHPDKKALQPCPDVYWFPVTSMRFCTDLINMMENFGQWSSGKNEDTRLEGGYEAVPTRDIHMNQVDWERHWLHFLKEYVRPLQEHVFTGYYHDPPRSLMNFVVRYRPDEQPSLRPHHDSSTYTINIALNTAGKDYTGGGCKFIRYNCSVVDTKPGWLLMHPGRLTHFHEGLLVTNGTRYIMISFVDP
ncbi:procollagen lysyl hydroxylase [Carabus blaptoides fortunei]